MTIRYGNKRLQVTALWRCNCRNRTNTVHLEENNSNIQHERFDEVKRVRVIFISVNSWEMCWTILCLCAFISTQQHGWRSAVWPLKCQGWIKSNAKHRSSYFVIKSHQPKYLLQVCSTGISQQSEENDLFRLLNQFPVIWFISKSEPDFNYFCEFLSTVRNLTALLGCLRL